MNDCKKTIIETRGRYERELTQNVVPFWEKYGIDRVNGGFFTCLERDGTRYDSFKQMWMQWRAVWTFAELYGSRFGRPEYLEYAERGFDFLTEFGKRDDGRYHFMLTADGCPMSDSGGGAEVFSESFAALACAALYRVAGDSKYLAEAEGSLAAYLKNASEAEKPLPSLPGMIARKRLAYRMILLNVMNEFGRIPGENRREAETDRIIGEMKSFEVPERGILLESTLPDGLFDLDTQDGRFTNPGHALEGMWFIMERCRSHPCRDDLDFALRCTRATLEYGWDAGLGGIFYFKDFLGKPLEKHEWMLKAWWPQNEAAVAALYAYEFSKDPVFLDWFMKLDAFALKNLRDDSFGEWFAYAPVDGRRAHSYKGSRWKGFFHLPRFLLKTVEILERLENETD